MATKKAKESDRDKFIRLANARVPKALRAIRLIGNLANRSNYASSPEDARRIIDALEKELKAVKAKFETTTSKGEIGFRLK